MNPWKNWNGQLPGADDLYIWLIDLDTMNDINPYREALNQQEKERAQRFYFEKDRRAFTVCRGFVKKRLAEIGRVEPCAIKFNTSEKGKPFLPGSDIFFNVSHTAGKALTAITRLAPVGVDIERYRPDMAESKIAERFFSQQEVRDFNNLPDSLKTVGFFNAWTRKEAFIKAIGLGLSMPLNAFDVTLHPDEAVRLKAVRHKNYRAEEWLLQALPLKAPYAGAWCIRHQHPRVHLWYLASPDA